MVGYLALAHHVKRGYDVADLRGARQNDARAEDNFAVIVAKYGILEDLFVTRYNMKECSTYVSRWMMHSALLQLKRKGM